MKKLIMSNFFFLFAFSSAHATNYILAHDPISSSYGMVVVTVGHLGNPDNDLWIIQGEKGLGMVGCAGACQAKYIPYHLRELRNRSAGDIYKEMQSELFGTVVYPAIDTKGTIGGWLYKAERKYFLTSGPEYNYAVLDGDMISGVATKTMKKLEDLNVQRLTGKISFPCLLYKATEFFLLEDGEGRSQTPSNVGVAFDLDHVADQKKLLIGPYHRPKQAEESWVEYWDDYSKNTVSLNKMTLQSVNKKLGELGYQCR